MFICLSSGARARYREDILRAIAMPEGSRLQFRYDKDYVDSAVQTWVDKGEDLAGDALICYLDASDKAHPPVIVPCRRAKLLRPERHGTFFTLQLELGDLLYTPEPGTFSESLRRLPGLESLPNWDSTSEHAVGSFWARTSDGLKNLDPPSDDVERFEKLAAQLSSRTEFESEQFFLHTQGVYEVTTGNRLHPKDGRFEVQTNTEYELRLIHRDPRKQSGSAAIQVETASAGVELVGKSSFAVDSPYDTHRIRFMPRGETTVSPLSRSSGVMTLVLPTRVRETEKDHVWSYDVEFRIARSWKSVLGIVVSIIVFLMLTPVAQMMSTGALRSAAGWYQLMLPLVSAVGVAISVALGFRRSF